MLSKWHLTAPQPDRYCCWDSDLKVLKVLHKLKLFGRDDTGVQISISKIISWMCCMLMILLKYLENSLIALETLHIWSFRRHATTSPVTSAPSKQCRYNGWFAGSIIICSFDDRYYVFHTTWCNPYLQHHECLAVTQWDIVFPHLVNFKV